MKKIITILMCFFLLLSITACVKDKEDTPKTEIILVEKLDFEINSELKLLKLIYKIKNGEIISEDEIIC